jgi:hypothetical protein
MKTLKANSRWGKYNLCDPSEESLSVHLDFFDGEKSKYINLSFKDESYNVNGFISAEEAMEMIDEWKKHIWFSSSEKENDDFKKLLDENIDEIATGNKIAKIEQLTKKKLEIEKEIESLSN